MPVLYSPMPVEVEIVYASVWTSMSDQPCAQQVPSLFVTLSISMWPYVPVTGRMSKSSSRMSSLEKTVPPPINTRGADATRAPLTSTYLRRTLRWALALLLLWALAVFVSVRRVRQKGFEPSSRGAPPAWTAGNDSGGGKPPSGRLESEDRAAGVPVEALEPSPGSGCKPFVVTPTWSEES